MRGLVWHLHLNHILLFTSAHLQPAANCCCMNLKWMTFWFLWLRVSRTFLLKNLLLQFRSCCVGLSAVGMERLNMLQFELEKIIFIVQNKKAKCIRCGLPTHTFKKQDLFNSFLFLKREIPFDPVSHIVASSNLQC